MPTAFSPLGRLSYLRKKKKIGMCGLLYILTYQSDVKQNDGSAEGGEMYFIFLNYRNIMDIYILDLYIIDMSKSKFM